MSSKSRELSVFGVGAVIHNHNMLVIMARIIGQSEALVPNLQAALAQSHSFDPKKNRLIEYDVDDAIDTAKQMLNDQFQALRKATVVNLCAVCEQFVKTVAAERRLEFSPLSGGDAFERAFEQIDKKFWKIKKMAAPKFVTLLGEFCGAPDLPKSVSDALNEVFLVRNALVHNGGRVDRRLADEFPQSHQPNVQISISAEALHGYIQSINSLTTLVFEFNWGSEL